MILGYKTWKDKISYDAPARECLGPWISDLGCKILSALRLQNSKKKGVSNGEPVKIPIGRYEFLS